jgi:flagellar hook-associated protein FlgK
MDPLSIARYGMITAENKASAAASRIANWNTDGADVVQEDANLLEAQQQFAASAKVVSFANDMWRALMDIQKS